MRTPASVPQRARKAAVASFPAPTEGWISNYNLSANWQAAGKAAATVLDNWWPTPQNVQMRRGCALYAQLPGETGYVTALMSYSNGGDEKLFAATQTAIYDITSPNSVVQVQSGLTGGNWNYTQFATTGGTFLVAVNGMDAMRLFDGTRWWPIGSDDIAQIPVSNVTVQFHVGEIVTGATSGAKGSVLYVDNGMLYVTKMGAAKFSSGESITGSLGGAATASSAEVTWWAGITADTSSAIKTINTASFGFVWGYMGRLWFAQKDSLNAWYLNADAVGGSAIAFPMGGVFPSGGALLFGSSWSLDNSGNGGLSEQCVMVTDQGECAVYQGYDPNLASSWEKVGLYRIDKPRGARAFVRNGGDLLIATDTGMIPLAQAIQKNIATLAPAAVSYPIEHDWNSYVAERSDRKWQVAIWPENQMLAIALPHLDGYEDAFLVANTRTGAWARFTGWNGSCMATFQGRLFFGGPAGTVAAAWQTGTDMGLPFSAVFVPLFSDGGDSTSRKYPKDARVMVRGTYEVTWGVMMQYDYVLNIPSAPSGAIAAGDSLWDEERWDTSAVWSSTETKLAQRLWKGVAGSGYAFAPCLQITSGNLAPLDNELVRVDVSYVTGGLMS